MKRKILFSLLFFLLFVLGMHPNSLATFVIKNFTIDATLDNSGDLHVTENIQYYTNESVNGLTRNIKIQNPRNKKNSADALKLYAVKVNGLDYKQTSAAEIGDNGVFEYTSSGSDYNIKVYSPFVSSTKYVEYEYVLKNVAVKYDDIAELYWNFIGNEWDNAIEYLEIHITLPTETMNETSYVFGHGSNKGSFTKRGNNITLYVYDIPAYQAIDARILFSRDAISASNKIINTSVLDKYVDQEEGLSQHLESNKILGDLSVTQISLILSSFFAIIFIIFYMVFDKEVKVEKYKYYREIPNQLEPELLQLIYYKKFRPNSFYVAVLNLIKLGVYKIEKNTNKEDDDVIVYCPNHNATLKEYQENLIVTLNGFLEDDENGRKSITLSKLNKKMSRSTGSGYKRFKEGLEKERENLFGKIKKVPKKAINALFLLLLIFFIVSYFCTYTLTGDISSGFIIAFFILIIYLPLWLINKKDIEENASIPFLLYSITFQLPFLFFLISLHADILFIPYILLYIFTMYIFNIKKYPKEEQQITAYVQGLRRYIEDYSLLNKKDDLDYIQLWEDYFIMAIALNLNHKTINYFYNYGKEQIDSNLGYSIHDISSYHHFYHSIGDSFRNYRDAYATSSSSGSSFSGSSGGFSGGSSSGGGGGRRRWWKPFLSVNCI